VHRLAEYVPNTVSIHGRYTSLVLVGSRRNLTACYTSHPPSRCAQHYTAYDIPHMTQTRDWYRVVRCHSNHMVPYWLPCKHAGKARGAQYEPGQRNPLHNSNCLHRRCRLVSHPERSAAQLKDLHLPLLLLVLLRTHHKMCHPERSGAQSKDLHFVLAFACSPPHPP
jgi:hypothetical protein